MTSASNTQIGKLSLIDDRIPRTHIILGKDVAFILFPLELGHPKVKK